MILPDIPHQDIIRYVHDFEHIGYTVRIVERKMNSRLFLYFYVFDLDVHQCGGSNYVFFGDVKEEDLSDLDVAVPKIKTCIDNMVASHIKWKAEKLQRKKELNWIGQTFKRGDAVYFKGNSQFVPTNTFVWTYFGHDGLEFYLIAHNDGYDRSNWMAKPPFANQDGFECVHSSQLQEGLKYIQIDCSREFQGETDELVLLKK